VVVHTETSTNYVARQPLIIEAPLIKELIDDAVKAGLVLPRSLGELCECLRDFQIIVDEHGVAGCAALHIDTESLAEIRSLVVRKDLRGRNIGSLLVEACIREAKRLGISRVYALTRVPEFFTKRGFFQVDKHELPSKVFKDCVRCHLFPGCDELAMVHDIPQSNSERTAS
jgi:amino-acid N-acetyltransferase